MNAKQDEIKIPEDCIFYQTMHLPGVGLIKGSWDHRHSIDTFLGHVDFQGKTVLDVGPASGFFSFEIEKKGAQVVALDLGQEAEWDMVPNNKTSIDNSKKGRKNAVRMVENSFWFAHNILDSSVKLIYGSMYETPNLVENVDIALMSNVLQHLRDPFLAIEQVSKVVDETIIITEAVWDADKKFMNNVGMRFLPRAEILENDHSWWLVSPALVREILRLLGFGDIMCEFHRQQFNGYSGQDPPQMIKHYTITGKRMNHLFLEGWHSEEHDGENIWRWSSGVTAKILLKFPESTGAKCNIWFSLWSIKPNKVTVRLNGSKIWSGIVRKELMPVSLHHIKFGTNDNILEFESKNQPVQENASDQRKIGFALYNFGNELISA